MAAKAKLLLRELKTVKADLAFAKERCAQLEEENKMLRESYDKGDNPEDDDLVSLSLEKRQETKKIRIIDCLNCLLKCILATSSTY
jgi:cell shape-determining protein MreC